MPATAQSRGLSMFGNVVLTYWFASTLRASLQTLHPADAFRSFGDYVLCPKWGSSANGGLFCMGTIRRSPVVCVLCERATGRFTGPWRLQRKAGKKQMVTRPGQLARKEEGEGVSR